MTCLSCGGETKPWLSTPIDCKKNEPTPYGNVVRCVECGMGSLDPIPPANEIAAFYDLPSYYTQGEGHIKKRVGNSMEKLLDKLAYWADRGQLFAPVAMVGKEIPANARVCDLGCGNADYLQRFRKAFPGADLVGVDPDPKARAEAAKGGVKVIDGTADSLPQELDGQLFDLVIMTHALEHCRDPRAAMENAFRLTKPGGHCYIEVPNCDSAHFRTFTICSENFEVPRHIQFFTTASLSRLAESVGYHVKAKRYVYYLRDFMPGWRDWEATIADRVLAADPSAKAVNHTFVRSVMLFLSSFWRTPDRKYDSFGLLLTTD